ncbi:MAG: pantetheine-phosphate adenylyltransferase [Candidatus Omnitrophota bacterium]
MKKRAIYPGSFDPVTYGHIDLIKRAVRIFDKVIVAVAHSSDKKTLFSVEERVRMLNMATKDMQGIIIDDFEGLSVEYVQRKGASVIIRGIRMISDFEYEFQMALTNRALDALVETIFMMPAADYSYISSKLIKEAAMLGADVSCFVPAYVAAELKNKFSHKKFSSA